MEGGGRSESGTELESNAWGSCRKSAKNLKSDLTQRRQDAK